MIEARQKYTSGDGGTSEGVARRGLAMSLTGLLVIFPPKFLSLPIIPLGVLGVWGSVLFGPAHPEKSSEALGTPPCIDCWRVRAAK